MKQNGDEFYCIDAQALEPGDLLNALKLLLDGRLPFYVQIARDSLGKAHAFRFSTEPRMVPLSVMEVGDEEVFLPTMATRFNRAVARVRFDVDKSEGVLHMADKEGDLTATSFKNEPLPPFPGRLFERQLTWGEPVWLGSGPPAGRPVRPPPNTPGYDVPLEAGSYIGAFADLKISALDALKEEVEKQATGELTFRAADKVEARLWLEGGAVVGMVHDALRGANTEKTWDAIQEDEWVQRRFRRDVPRPDHINYVKTQTAKLIGAPKK